MHNFILKSENEQNSIDLIKSKYALFLRFQQKPGLTKADQSLFQSSNLKLNFPKNLHLSKLFYQWWTKVWWLRSIKFIFTIRIWNLKLPLTHSKWNFLRKIFFPRKNLCLRSRFCYLEEWRREFYSPFIASFTASRRMKFTMVNGVFCSKRQRNWDLWVMITYF